MAESISRKVASFLEKNPNISNADLYAKFPRVRENTLRNYKSKFKATLSQQKPIKASSQAKTKVTEESIGSLRKKVFEFFQENPKATNQKLYETFSDFSKNKLRHYKASFFKSIESLSEESEKIGKKVAKRIRKPVDPLSSLEARVNQLEKQVDKLTKVIAKADLDRSPQNMLLTGKASMERKIRDLEGSVVKFIDEKRQKIKSEISQLDDIQHLVTEKINNFVQNFREKK